MVLSCYAAAKNKAPILAELEKHINITNFHNNEIKIFEVASGTGEHAAYFCSSLLNRNLIYQPTEPDRTMHESIVSWAGEMLNKSILPPVAVDVLNYDGNDSQYNNLMKGCCADIIICINMIHISPLPATEGLFRVSSIKCRAGGHLFLYGPFRIQNEMVQSNVDFDSNLKSRNPDWGVRDLEYVTSVGDKCGFDFIGKVDMPSNNYWVNFKKRSP